MVPLAAHLKKGGKSKSQVITEKYRWSYKIKAMEQVKVNTDNNEDP
ncbi:hypothetical protein [Mucilaginibacter sp. SP1R1]|nr:hypothetical protein [Mucilaginibacter sp. SP1R1]